MPVELVLGDFIGVVEIVVGQSRVQNLVAVLGQERRLDAAWSRIKAVEEDDSHGAL